MSDSATSGAGDAAVDAVVGRVADAAVDPEIGAAPLAVPPTGLRPPEARRRQALQALFGSTFARTFASPFLVVENHVIACPVAIRFYKKDFQYVSRQLLLEYQYRAWRGFDKVLLDRYAAIGVAKLTAIDALMQNSINRLRKLLEQQGHEADLTLWPNAHVTDVPIIATQARTYLEVLAKMDRVYTLAGTANLLGVIDSAQRAEVELACKKAVRAFRSVLQNEAAVLYREAERIMGVQREVPADAGMPTAAQVRVDVSPPSVGSPEDAADEEAEDDDAAATQPTLAPAPALAPGAVAAAVAAAVGVAAVGAAGGVTAAAVA